MEDYLVSHGVQHDLSCWIGSCASINATVWEQAHTHMEKTYGGVGGRELLTGNISHDSRRPAAGLPRPETLFQVRMSKDIGVMEIC